MITLPRRLRPALAVLLLLVGAGAASACDPSLIDGALEEADGQLAYALRAEDISGSRLHLRRVAHAMTEAEAQFISCNCANAQIEAGNAAAEARRAANASAFEELAIAVDATLASFQLTLLAMQDELCR